MSMCQFYIDINTPVCNKNDLLVSKCERKPEFHEFEHAVKFLQFKQFFWCLENEKFPNKIS